MTAETWRQATERALYGPGGFFIRNAPASQFRTSVHASPLFAGALARLARQVHDALGRPQRMDIVDVGAGRGELLTALGRELADIAPALTAVELAPRPGGLPEDIAWRRDVPEATTGLLIATEWLDNVPVDVVRRDEDGLIRLVRTDGTLGEPAGAEDLAWLAEWWPDFAEAEPGWPRDRAWRRATEGHTGLALAVDYGHTLADRPVGGSLTGYREGLQVDPRPDGSTDITAHVAMDSLGPGLLLTQRDALLKLGVTGQRPPLSEASTDPRGYLAKLAAAGQAAELCDPAGLGRHWWLLQSRGLDMGRCWRD
ncbi:SAM-dependent methyltransferase [Longispora albida]|uniref:SAM-dependent methyltransferase n=1 Tax=Longispora albida TaxID=203523 RepID=UPI00036EE0FB|nr:SAM-dependent methyltransferase [Longispora albida]